MNGATQSELASELRRALQALTRAAGMQRSDLLEALTGELSALRHCWSVDVANGAEAATNIIAANIEAHVKRLVPPTTRGEISVEQLRRRYRLAVLVSFNVPLKNYELLLTMDLSTRRKWLSDTAPDGLRVSISTAQRYLANAITQIEQHILVSGYEPVRADARHSPTDWFAAGELDSKYVTREALHAKFVSALQQTTPSAKLVAIVGLPGMGKTWLARNVITAVTGKSPPVVRVFSNQPYAADVQAVFSLCGIDSNKSATLANILSDDRAPDFLVLDNLDSSSQLGQLLPRQYRSTVVATCRVAEHPPPECRIIDVGTMTSTEAQELVQRQLPQLSTEDTATVAASLYDYPLAIDHACRLLKVGREGGGQQAVDTFCRDLRGRLSTFTGESVTEQSNQALRIVIGDLVAALQARNSSAAELLMLLVHARLYGPMPGIALPQGLLMEALNWRSGRVIGLSEYLESFTMLDAFFHLESGQAQSRTYRTMELDNIQLHAAVAQVLFWNIYGYHERAVAAGCLVRGAMTYAGRPEVQSTYGREYRTDVPVINAGILSTVAVFLLTPQYRAHPEQFAPELRRDVELWFWFHARGVRDSFPPHLAAAFQLVEGEEDMTPERIKFYEGQYIELHKRYMLQAAGRQAYTEPVRNE